MEGDGGEEEAPVKGIGTKDVRGDLSILENLACPCTQYRHKT